MNRIIPPLAAALCVLAGQGLAQGLSALELSVETLVWADEGSTGDTTYGGGIEFSILPSLGVAAHLGSYGAADATNVTLHAIYGLMGFDTGLFLSRDSVEDGTIDTVGIEGAFGFLGGSVEGYFGLVDGLTTEGTTGGIAGRFEITNALAATGSIGFADLDVTTNRIAIGAEYSIPAGPSVFGELGRINMDGDDEAYLSIGASVAVGPNGRTTFSGRSLFEILPGY
ncbi:MAG: hypothetical protein JJT81_05270 [Rubellimicrobium sp.]|nr:hypothetical protein [Rubellimicrobium sp.]